MKWSIPFFYFLTHMFMLLSRVVNSAIPGESRSSFRFILGDVFTMVVSNLNCQTFAPRWISKQIDPRFCRDSFCPWNVIYPGRAQGLQAGPVLGGLYISTSIVLIPVHNDTGESALWSFLRVYNLGNLQAGGILSSILLSFSTATKLSRS